MLEDDGFRLVGRITQESNFQIRFDLLEAESWAPAIYAFRIGGKVVRIGKTEHELVKRVKQWNRDVSRALVGDFRKGGTNPWEACEWRRRLTEHGPGEFLAQRWCGNKQGLRRRETELVNHADPPLNNEGPSGRKRQQESRSVKNVAAAKEYWKRLNNRC